MFSLRIVNVDHYMSPPKCGLDLTYSQFRGNQVKSVPVLRIFGSTPSGCKTCLHIHGVFPYILIPYTGAGNPGPFMYQLAASLDKAVNISLGTSNSNRQHVFKISHVSGRPFYGYHGQDHLFLKIFFYNPLIVKRASDLLQNGAICGTQFQIHESHIPFVLQFFIDYNLYGMSFINLKNVVFRKDAHPPGVTPGELTRESFCELEADAVAVDILNRLTIEGELAVNPGLAAIWREEKERLKKDALDSSQRPTPQRTMSEALLKDKLMENLVFQGKCKTRLKGNIPYPVETQKSATSSEILDASALDTHSISSLTISNKIVDEITIIDEELVLSLTQNSATSNSLDQSLLVALDTLAAPNEMNVTLSQNVDDDSILGSQIQPLENSCEDDLGMAEYNSPADASSDDNTSVDNDHGSDESFEDIIPQLDGIGDVLKRKKRTKKGRRKVLVENTVDENMSFDNSFILQNDIKDTDCWPDSGKQEDLNEIFSDDEPFNSPIHSFEDNIVNQDDPVNIDVIDGFDAVLRGDPCFSRDLTSEDILWNCVQSSNTDDMCDSRIDLSDSSRIMNESVKSTGDNTIPEFAKDNKVSSFDRNKYTCDSTVPSLNNNLEVSDIDKPMSLLSCGEDFLNTSQLDEIFNQDLNKGLEIIYENNSQHENEETIGHPSFEIERSEDLLDLMQISEDTLYNQCIAEEEELSKINLPDDTLSENSVENSKKRITEIVENDSYFPFTIINNDETTEICEIQNIQDCDKTHDWLDSDVRLDSKSKVKRNSVDEKTEKNKVTKSLKNKLRPRNKNHNNRSEILPITSSPETPCDSPTKKKNVTATKMKFNLDPARSPSKFKKHSIIIAQKIVLFTKQKKALARKQNSSFGSFEMSKIEIDEYFTRLETIASSRLVDRSNVSNSELTIWTTPDKFQNKTGHKKIKEKFKDSKLRKIMKLNSLTSNEEIKTIPCFVKLKKLTSKEIKRLCQKNNLKKNIKKLNNTNLDMSKRPNKKDEKLKLENIKDKIEIRTRKKKILQKSAFFSGGIYNSRVTKLAETNKNSDTSALYNSAKTEKQKSTKTSKKAKDTTVRDKKCKTSQLSTVVKGGVCNSQANKLADTNEKSSMFAKTEKGESKSKTKNTRDTIAIGEENVQLCAAVSGGVSNSQTTKLSATKKKSDISGFDVSTKTGKDESNTKSKIIKDTTAVSGVSSTEVRVEVTGGARNRRASKLAEIKEKCDSSVVDKSAETGKGESKTKSNKVKDTDAVCEEKLMVVKSSIDVRGEVMDVVRSNQASKLAETKETSDKSVVDKSAKAGKEKRKTKSKKAKDTIAVSEDKLRVMQSSTDVRDKKVSGEVRKSQASELVETKDKSDTSPINKSAKTGKDENKTKSKNTKDSIAVCDVLSTVFRGEVTGGARNRRASKLAEIKEKSDTSLVDKSAKTGKDESKTNSKKGKDRVTVSEKKLMALQSSTDLRHEVTGGVLNSPASKLAETKEKSDRSVVDKSAKIGADESKTKSKKTKDTTAVSEEKPIVVQSSTAIRCEVKSGVCKSQVCKLAANKEKSNRSVVDKSHKTGKDEGKTKSKKNKDTTAVCEVSSTDVTGEVTGRVRNSQASKLTETKDKCNTSVVDKSTNTGKDEDKTKSKKAKDIILVCGEKLMVVQSSADVRGIEVSGRVRESQVSEFAKTKKKSHTSTVDKLVKTGKVGSKIEPNKIKDQVCEGKNKVSQSSTVVLSGNCNSNATKLAEMYGTRDTSVADNSAKMEREERQSKSLKTKDTITICEEKCKVGQSSAAVTGGITMSRIHKSHGNKSAETNEKCGTFDVNKFVKTRKEESKTKSKRIKEKTEICEGKINVSQSYLVVSRDICNTEVNKLATNSSEMTEKTHSSPSNETLMLVPKPVKEDKIKPNRNNSENDLKKLNNSDNKAITNKLHSLNESNEYIEETLEITKTVGLVLKPVKQSQIIKSCRINSKNTIKRLKHTRSKNIASTSNFDSFIQQRSIEETSAISSVSLMANNSAKVPSYNDVGCCKESSPVVTIEDSIRLNGSNKSRIVEKSFSLKIKPLLINNNGEITSNNNVDNFNVSPNMFFGGNNIPCKSLNKPSGVQKENLPSSRERAADQNMNPLVVVAKINSSHGSSLNVENHFILDKSDFKPPCSQLVSNIKVRRKRSSSLDINGSRLSKMKKCISSCRKRSLRMYSLDGTVDSSSSDENVDDNNCSTESVNNTFLCRTPSKKSSSLKLNRTPKSTYVPLNIEIRKSPKVKDPQRTERKNKLFEGSSSKNFILEKKSDIGPIFVKSQEEQTSQDPKNSRLETTELDNERRRLEPVIKVQRISFPSTSFQPFPSTSSQPIPSTSSQPPHASRNIEEAAATDVKDSSVQPLVKRLKVSLKRLSSETQVSENPVECERLGSLRKTSLRSSSLPPTTSKEEIITTDNLEHNVKAETGNTEDTACGSGIQGLKSVDKGKKVRKALLFPEIRTEEQPKVSSSLKFKEIPLRKHSTDLFDLNVTSESNSTEVNLGVAGSFSEFLSQNLSGSSGLSKNSLPELGGEISSQSYSKSTKDDCKASNITIINPYGLSKSEEFTPATRPPSRTEVMSKLIEHGFSEVVNKEPFYSVPSDDPKSSEVGRISLKLESKSVLDLEEFQGTFSRLHRLKTEIKRDHSRTIMITPVKKPPTALEAQLWLKNKLMKKDKKQVVEEHKTVTRMMLPSSPGLLDDDSFSDSLTISQCTPLSKVSLKEYNTDNEQCTPHAGSSKEIEISPLMASTPVNYGIQLSKKRFTNVSSSCHKSLPPITEEVVTQKYTSSYEHDSMLQSGSITEKVNQLSESKIKKFLSESKSPATVSGLIDVATPNNSGNYRMELENLQDVKLTHEYQFLTILTMELHIHTRGELRPNPDHDAICSIFYNITNDSPDPSISHVTGAIYISDGGKEEKIPHLRCFTQVVPNEKSLILAFLALVRKWDPDIFVGYEIEMLSWGYLLQRAYILNINLVIELSRMKPQPHSEFEVRDVKENDSEIRLVGRIILDLWRFLRHEVALQSYTFENIMYHVLHQRVPLFSFCTMTRWWNHRTRMYRWQVFDHYLTRVEGVVKLLQQVDLVGRTSEFARLFGIQFYEVLSRGSQFRVESMMLRLVKPLNYVAVSPSIQQRAKMRAPESLPLIMEPESRFYSDPVIVLDFQSLYPSIIIAYNYCYSTCLGRVEHLGRSEIFEFGCTQLRVPFKDLIRLKDNLNFSPCGVAFVNQTVVKGVLPRMLEEILNTRLMVKQSMKEKKDNRTLQRVLHARQLGLKLIANVTYGYTSANFSGRMPCIEVGDSVVSKARETLERAIGLVGRNTQWGARVVYGDTDSMFVHVPGKSREEAFRIGAEIADAVTNDNPKPVKLKLEKVYQPCILQTKKRYVGYMYESPTQESPVYDAKGIETVRRDGCPAVAKILEKALRILFETKDLSLVKKYTCKQFSKVMSGRISIQELTFAREYRGASGYRPGACVPAFELAKQWRAVDPRSEPRVSERVPYVIVAGPPGLPLIRLVRSPRTLLSDTSLKINAEYYISRAIIPPLDRCFSLIGVNVALWYSELPRKQHIYLPSARPEGTKKKTISQYFATTNCVVCQQVTSSGVCPECQRLPQYVAVTLENRVRGWERRLALINKLCESCCGRPYETDCISLDCPILYGRSQACKDLKQADYLRDLMHEYLKF